MNMQLVLASSSKRRLELLKRIGLRPKVVTVNVKEVYEGMPPHKICILNAYKKAIKATREIHDSAIIIGADTIICHKGHIIGKPKNIIEARRILETLSGTWHEVYTGLCVIRTDDWCVALGYERTRVLFKELTKEEIDKYLMIEDPLDKAGGYAIQSLGAVFVKKIEGDFFNVMGLPLHVLYVLLNSIGIDLFKLILKGSNEDPY